MGLTDKLRRLGMRARLAWRAWRAVPVEPSEGLDEVKDTEPDFFEDEEDSQKAEIAEGLEEQLEGDFDALVHTLRGGNGHKKAKAN